MVPRGPAAAAITVSPVTSVRLLPATTSASVAGRLTAWTNAWLDGRVGPDDVIAGVRADGPVQHVDGLDGRTQPLAALLIDWRLRGATECRIALPVAGDVRGLPGPDDVRIAALEAGSVVLAAGTAGVPAAEPGHWSWFETGPVPHDPLHLREAEAELMTTMRETADIFTSLGPSRWHGDTAAGLAGARRGALDLGLPPDHPQQAVRLLALAHRLAAAIDLAIDQRSDGSITAADSGTRSTSLRALATVVRRALVAGYSATADSPVD